MRTILRILERAGGYRPALYLKIEKLHHLGPSKEDDPLTKTVLGYLRGVPEGTLGRLIMEMAILLRVNSAQDGNRVLAEAAKEYNVSVESIAAAVKKEFADREKAKAAKKAAPKPPAKAQSKPAKKQAAA